jgi:hypothetical protein
MVELAYGLYLLISIGMTVRVAQTLSATGEVFLVQCFGQNEVLARSTNHLLVVGFYLMNVGFITMALEYGAEPTDWPSMMRFLSSKVGLAVLVIGGMHFFNMHMIAKFGRRVSDWIVEAQQQRISA